MTRDSIFKQIINCPACDGQLRVNAGDEYMRVRCPHCRHEWGIGIPDAEVLTEASIPDAEVVEAAPSAQQSMPESGSTAPAKAEEKESYLGCLLFLVPLIIGGTWFFSTKAQVIEVEAAANGLKVTNEYYYAPEGRLFGIPAAVFRLFGVQSPQRMGSVRISDVMGDIDTNYVVVANSTDKDIYYRPMVYNLSGGESNREPPAPVKIGPGRAARVLGKTHGEYHMGCAAKPSDEETFSFSNGSSASTAVLGWITPVPQDQCPSKGDKEKVTDKVVDKIKEK